MKNILKIGLLAVATFAMVAPESAEGQCLLSRLRNRGNRGRRSCCPAPTTNCTPCCTTPCDSGSASCDGAIQLTSYAPVENAIVSPIGNSWTYDSSSIATPMIETDGETTIAAPTESEPTLAPATGSEEPTDALEVPSPPGSDEKDKEDEKASAKVEPVKNDSPIATQDPGAIVWVQQVTMPGEVIISIGPAIDTAPANGDVVAR